MFTQLCVDERTKKYCMRMFLLKKSVLFYRISTNAMKHPRFKSKTPLKPGWQCGTCHTSFPDFRRCTMTTALSSVAPQSIHTNIELSYPASFRAINFAKISIIVYIV